MYMNVLHSAAGVLRNTVDRLFNHATAYPRRETWSPLLLETLKSYAVKSPGIFWHAVENSAFETLFWGLNDLQETLRRF